MAQDTAAKSAVRNIVDQLIDSDIPLIDTEVSSMTVSEFVYSYFEESFLKIIDPMAEVVIDGYITVAQIEAIIYAFKQRTAWTTVSEINDTINKTYGREIV